jgi:hypothetical protein
MANTAHFVFPSAKESEIFDTAQPTWKERPLIQLNTKFEVGEGYNLAVPVQRCSRPAYLRSITPPDSPTRTRSSTTGSSPKMHDSGAITPPATPTSTAHGRSSSASSDFLTSLSGLRRGDSLSSSTSRQSNDESGRPGSTELLIFPHHLTDYQIQTDDEGRKHPIGFGAWSDVYLAKPSLSQPSDLPLANSVGTAMSPPITPVRSHCSRTWKTPLPSIPPLYAIKVPGSTSAKKVLDAEARVLSYLTRFPGAQDHIVSFYGQDTRTGALVLKAMDGTLDDWIEKHLNTLDDVFRAEKLASIFPTIALSLIDSLIWMQGKDCTHADIKPSNILTSSTPHSASADLVFSDFSSTILTNLTSNATPGHGNFSIPRSSALSTPRLPALPRISGLSASHYCF